MEAFLLAVGILVTMAAYLVVGVNYLGMRFPGQLNPGVFPVVIGSLAVVLGLAYLTTAAREWRQERLRIAISREVVEIILGMALLVLALSYLKFVICGTLFGLFFLYRFYTRKWHICAAYSLVVTGVFWAAFALGFKVPLP